MGMLPITSFMTKPKKQKVGGGGTVRLATLRDESYLQNGRPWDLSRNYWLATIFAIHGRPFPAMAMLVYVLYSALVVALVSQLLPHYRDSVQLKGIQYPVQTLGLALFLLISFRTQTAYDRWWEGRKSWGAIITLCIDIGRLSEAYVEDSALAGKIITWANVYAITLKHMLHYVSDPDKMPELANLISLGEHRKIKAKGATPLLALQQASAVLKKIGETQDGSSLARKSLIEIDKRLGRLGSEIGICLRIRNTPMPAGYVIHLRSFLVMWLLLLPFAFLASLGWYSIPLCFVVGYELFGYEEVGAKIENPFTYSYHALPLDNILGTILSNSAFFMGCIHERSNPVDHAHSSGPPPPPGAPPPRSKSDVAKAHNLDASAAVASFADKQEAASRRALYDRLGGAAAVGAAVDIFYQKLTSDPAVSYFFTGISMERLKAKQVKFLTYALGGADDYIGKDPTISHRRLHNEKGLRVEHFFIVVGHLQATLRQLGVSEDLIAECTKVLAPMEQTFGCGNGQVCIGHEPEGPPEKCPFDAPEEDNAEILTTMDAILK